VFERLGADTQREVFAAFLASEGRRSFGIFDTELRALMKLAGSQRQRNPLFGCEWCRQAS